MGRQGLPRNKKDGVVLQSQYVDYAQEPFVELVFSEGNGSDRRIYTVRRVPRHLKRITRGAAKGTGTREITGNVTLTMPDGSDYPAKEADAKLEEIVGLTKHQFMQVAMIAQGDFMETSAGKIRRKKADFQEAVPYGAVCTGDGGAREPQTGEGAGAGDCADDGSDGGCPGERSRGL